MRILLVNDDGYGKEGIETLSAFLEKRGDDVYIVAPAEEKSGSSHSFSINKELKVERMGKNRYAVWGTPADAASLALRSEYMLPSPPDLVISGINRGYNIGMDTIYSGTCAAAREAAMIGFRSIAISSECDGYEDAAKFLISNIDKFSSLPGKGTFLNINVPLRFNGKGISSTLGKFSFSDRVDKVGTGNDMTLILVGLDRILLEEKDGIISDVSAVEKGYASLSLVPVMPDIAASDIKRVREALV